MDVIQYLMQGFSIASQPINLILAFCGALIGTCVGILPGIGPINGVAILLPIAYAIGFSPESTLILLAGVYYGAEYGGRVSSILLNVPGDAGAVFTTLDGYPLAQKGLGGSALALSGISSFIGGTIAVIGLTFFGPVLAKLAISFGPAEYFVLMLFAFTSLSAMTGSNPLKAMVCLCLGLMLAVVGVDSATGIMRFTFNQPELFDGIEFLTVVIGLFAISETLLLLEKTYSGKSEILKVGRTLIKWTDLISCKWTIIRSSILGFIIGILPGTGASIASAVSYAVEKKISDKDHSFGTGNYKGLAAPEAANNASAVGAMVPMLTLGIPGSGTTAILLGALLLFNINPGPMLFSHEPELVWGLIASMFIGNTMLLFINIPMIRIFTKILLVPHWLLVSGIIVLSFVGVFSVNGSIFSLFVMILLGVASYILRKLNFPLPPLILGFVLGELIENNLRRALAISGGDTDILFKGTIIMILWTMVLSITLLPFTLRLFSRKVQEIGEVNKSKK